MRLINYHSLGNKQLVSPKNLWSKFLNTKKKIFFFSPSVATGGKFL